MIISSERTWLLKISDKEVQYKTLKQIPTVNNSHKHKQYKIQRSFLK